MGIFNSLFGRRKRAEESTSSQSEKGQWVKTWERKHAVENQDILGRSAVVTRLCPVSKHYVLTGDMHDVDEITRIAIKELQQHGRSQPWNLTISGYDHDPRGLWEIPEVRAWCKKTHAKAGYLPCLLSENAISWYALCILDVETVGRRKRSMVREERRDIESLLQEVSRKDPQAAEGMRQSLEWVGEFRFKSHTDVQLFMTEVGIAGSKFFKQYGVNNDIVNHLLIETGKRIARALSSYQL